MKILIFPAVIFIVACGSTPERVKSSGPQGSSPEVLQLLGSAKKLAELQRQAQPNSWNVSIEEAMEKENPFIPPTFVLNSGLPPKPNPYPYDSGLWNCQKLNVGSSICDIDSRKHMIAVHYPEKTKSGGGGQLAVFGTNYSLIADCNESDGVIVRLKSRYFHKFNNKPSKLEIGFDNDPVANYGFTKIDEYGGVITDTNLLLAELMKDFTSVTVRAYSEKNASEKSFQFLVKNFPKAWAVACGWYADYDVVTGIK